MLSSLPNATSTSFPRRRESSYRTNVYRRDNLFPKPSVGKTYAASSFPSAFVGNPVASIKIGYHAYQWGC